MSNVNLTYPFSRAFPPEQRRELDRMYEQLVKYNHRDQSQTVRPDTQPVQQIVQHITNVQEADLGPIQAQLALLASQLSSINNRLTALENASSGSGLSVEVSTWDEDLVIPAPTVEAGPFTLHQVELSPGSGPYTVHFLLPQGYQFGSLYFLALHQPEPAEAVVNVYQPDADTAPLDPEDPPQPPAEDPIIRITVGEGSPNSFYIFSTVTSTQWTLLQATPNLV